MKPLLVAITLALASELVVADTSGFYRTDAAPVIEQPRVAPTIEPGVARLKDASRKFGAAYSRSGRPRIVIYWNRVLSDDIEQRKESSIRRVESHRTRDVASSESTAGAAGAMTVDEVRGSASREVELIGTTRTIDTGKREVQLDTGKEWALQSGLMTNLRNAGARLVDRAMILRNSHLKHAVTDENADGHKATDVLRTEGNALHGYADILLEIEMVPDTRSPAGLGFKVTARRISNGVNVMTYYSQAVPPQGIPDERYKATAGGFQKIQGEVPAPTLAQVADQLSAEVLEQLAQGFE